ncbi:hypothetical protein SOPP22_03980 [Shewanella sp. OPT22]|nr:hypothetical protein SOPP22_03980 [Shewanella sp. OPT22]
MAVTPLKSALARPKEQFDASQAVLPTERKRVFISEIRSFYFYSPELKANRKPLLNSSDVNYTQLVSLSGSNSFSTFHERTQKDQRIVDVSYASSRWQLYSRHQNKSLSSKSQLLNRDNSKYGNNSIKTKPNTHRASSKWSQINTAANNFFHSKE